MTNPARCVVIIGALLVLAGYHLRLIATSLLVSVVREKADCAFAAPSGNSINNDATLMSIPEEQQGSPAATQQRIQWLDLPAKTTSVIFNIGANIDPVLPRPDLGPCAIAIAFEPIVYQHIDAHTQLRVIPAAVSTQSGLATMYDYGPTSVSSSLTHAAKAKRWNGQLSGEAGGGLEKIVPVISLTNVIDAIPPHIDIPYIMTDVQGHDFPIVESALSRLVERKVGLLRTEVLLDQKVSFQNSTNDLCTHWLPTMTKYGYVFDQLDPPREIPGYMSHEELERTCADQLAEFDGIWHVVKKESDALWRLKSVYPTQLPIEKYNFPHHWPGSRQGQKQKWVGLVPEFNASEYATCH